MKQLLGWLRMFGLVLAAAVLSEMPGIKQAGQAVDRLRDPLLAVAIGLTALGFAVFMGGILSLLMASGEPMTHEEIEAAIGQRQGAGEAAAWRASAHRVFGPAAGQRAANETTFAGIKDAWRTGEWRRDAQWQRLFLIASGAGLLFHGLFGLFLVIGPGPIRVLVAGAMVYATVMTGRGFIRA